MNSSIWIKITAMKSPSKISVLLILLATTCLTSRAAVDIYSPDSNHLWNRLYAALIVREKDGEPLDDLIDAPFWFDTKHLLSGESNTRAVALLREFVENRDVLDKMSPLQRAVMQRDLLAVFHWVSGKREKPTDTAEQRSLAEDLVRAIRHVALTAEEIRALPDNYTVAAALPGAFTAFDEAEPTRAFLPKGLLADDGEWLALDAPKDRAITAPVHFNMFRARSSFELHFRHPGGREAGQKYLAELAAMPNPLVFEKPADPIPRFGDMEKPWLNPDTPQFPVGTMWALVRRAILVDAQGNLIASPIVESVEVRVYRAVEYSHLKMDAQTFFEWELSRRLLLGKGGFHRTTPADAHFSQFLPTANNSEEDAMTRKPADSLSCVACHNPPGIHSVITRVLNIGEDPISLDPARARTRLPEFRATTSARLSEASVNLASKQPNWQLLRRTWGAK